VNRRPLPLYPISTHSVSRACSFVGAMKLSISTQILLVVLFATAIAVLAFAAASVVLV